MTPANAPKRGDLPFLKRRTRPAPVKPIDYTRHSSAKPAAPVVVPVVSAAPVVPGAPAASAAAAPAAAAAPNRSPSAPPIDYHHRGSAGGSSSLDLSGPPSTSPPAGGTSSLDLSGPPAPVPAPVDPARPDRSSSLDLDDRTPPTPAPFSTPRAPTRPALPVRSGRRIASREQVLLDVRNPTVTLTRVQSGIGTCAAEAVCSAEIGDLRLGALYQLRSGGSSTVQHAGGHRYGPPSGRHPILVGGREQYERIAIDLRQVRDIERIAFFAFSESRTELTWGGTFVLSTFGGGRIELPLETLYAGRIAVLASLYNLDGELVVRAEMETIAGDVREAARAYGYDRITWRDDRTPVD